jgi:hypothetical protein
MSTPYHHQFDASTYQVRDTTYNWIFVLPTLDVLGCSSTNLLADRLISYVFGEQRSSKTEHTQYS